MGELQKRLRQEMQQALKDKEPVKLTVLRGIVTAMTNELVAKGRKPSEELSDDEVMGVLKRQLKQRKDSIEQFRAGGREDLAEIEEAEVVYIEPYMPQMASKEEIRNVAEQKMTELGMHPDNESQKGSLIGAVMKEFAGRADGGDVKAVVEELFGAK